LIDLHFDGKSEPEKDESIIITIILILAIAGMQ